MWCHLYHFLKYHQLVKRNTSHQPTITNITAKLILNRIQPGVTSRSRHVLLIASDLTHTLTRKRKKATPRKAADLQLSNNEICSSSSIRIGRSSHIIRGIHRGVITPRLTLNKIYQGHCTMAIFSIQFSFKVLVTKRLNLTRN